MGYARRALAGFGWQTVLKIANNVLVLGKLVVLARLLSPADFGTFSIIMIALGISESVTQTGVNVTILQSKHSVEYFLDSAWVIAIIRGFIISLLMFGLGFGLGEFYDQPSLVYLIGLAALVPVIKGFINPAIVGLHKSLSFFYDTVYRMSLTLVETIAAITLGWLMHSVLALVVAVLVAAVFEVVISFIFFKNRPRFAYAAARGDIILKNARWLSLSSILSYLTENLDNLLIGKIAGTFNLGLYQNSYALGHEPNYEVTKSIHHGTLPVYTRLAQETARVRRAFARTILMGTVVTGLLSLPLLLFPELIIRLLLGSQWLGAVSLLPWLVVAGWLQGVIMLCYTLLIAKKQLKLMNMHAMTVLLVMIVGIMILGNQWGTIGGVWGVVLSRVITLPILVWVTVKSAYAAEAS